MKTNSSIDLSYLEVTFEGNKDTIHIILQSFIKNTPQLTKELIECMASDSWEKAAQLAHKIKSSFITVGAKNTGDLLEKILTESSLKSLDEVKQLKKMSEQVFKEVNSTIYSYGK